MILFKEIGGFFIADFCYTTYVTLCYLCKKTYKKLPADAKEIIDDAIRAIYRDPKIGQLKKGDLAGCYVHKFTVKKQQKLLTYAFDDKYLVLLALGTHENFYRDLKR